VVAEALLDQGADLVLVPPCPPDAFAAVSVRPAAEGWVARFRACLAQSRVIVLEAALHDDLDFSMTSRRAMGLARLHATRIDGTVRQVAVAAPAQVGGTAGTAADMTTWESSGGKTVFLASPCPLRPVEDAVQGAQKFAGRVMTRAARIEPVTPPGLVYATEAFACEIALTPRASVACDYAGLVPTAKDFGTLPLYAVRGI
jgi:hypothetical protein